MAYLLDEEEEKQDQEGEPQGIVAPSAPVTGDTSSPDAPSAPAPATSDFVSFDRYYNANADAATASANQLASSATAAGDKATTAITGATEEFTSALNGNQRPGFPSGTLTETTPAAPAKKTMKGRLSSTQPLTVVDDANVMTGAPGAQNLGEVTKTDATKLVETPYTAPGSILDTHFGDLAGDVEKANQNVNALQSKDGIQALLHGASDGGVADELDAALVGRAGGQNFRALKDKYGSLTKLLDDNVKSTGLVGDYERTYGATEIEKAKAALEKFKNRPPPSAASTDPHAPRAGHPNGTYVYNGPNGPEVRDYPSSNHVGAKEDATGSSAVMAKVGVVVIQVIAAAGGPQGAAGAAAVLGANQAWADATEEEQRAMWDQWSAEAETKWNDEHPEGPPYQKASYEELMEAGRKGP